MSESSSVLRRVPRVAVGAVLAVSLFGGVLAAAVLPDRHGAAPQAGSSGPSAVPYVAIPGCYNHTVPPAQRPTKLNVVGCASVAVALQDMSWNSWGAQGADGTGTAVFKICDPNCAMGYQLNNPVVIHAWNPEPPRANATCPVGLKVFSDMILAFPKGAPPPATLKMNTQYNGLPAVHYANYPGNKSDAEFIGYTVCN